MKWNEALQNNAPARAIMPRSSVTPHWIRFAKVSPFIGVAFVI